MTNRHDPDLPRETSQRRDGARRGAVEWWREAVCYQVYLRSFADGNGDGVGDLAGLRRRLPYLSELGVDAVWINPWYPSPMADGGYDVSDYRAIDPTFGSLPEARALIEEIHTLGLRILIDLVPNHTSSQHPWFGEALAGGPGCVERGRYIFRPGRGPDGGLPPNNWRSVFGGSAWTRVVEPDGMAGEWYLHLFAPEQPDLNWNNAEVRREFESVLRFWFDHGVDGIRIDVAHAMSKAPGLPDLGPADIELIGSAAHPGHPHWDREGVHELFRDWRAVADSYAEPRVFVAEACARNPECLSRYVRPGELHTAFNFDYLTTPWRAAHMRTAIDSSLTTTGAVGAPATWVLSNHDVVRHLTRYGRPQSDGPVHDLADHVLAGPFDLDLGTRRARAAALLTLALPGCTYLYQGEELGLWEVEDLPDEVLQDPIWQRSGHTYRGREGCRVPMPWSGDTPPFGFSPDHAGTVPWLPQPQEWRRLTVQVQQGDERSMLELYRRALHIRRLHPALGTGSLEWDPAAGSGVLSFTRSPGFQCIVNFRPDALRLPDHDGVLLSSVPLENGRLPGDAAVWLTR
ncbi:glycoside hydrolase family 13 protein [Streptomyces chryseus]|uniref:glycoside hydrolase family 13 protein n=1 Tax=Streptomyces chryseus TaxID=68186 RepID=UPI00110FBFAA|nr:glycoside hydrolase family 13 protein [Streptomyces chryseus]GGX39107.1 alpha-glucosidase [Streptomyces chryseus]